MGQGDVHEIKKYRSFLAPGATIPFFKFFNLKNIISIQQIHTLMACLLNRTYRWDYFMNS